MSPHRPALCPHGSLVEREGADHTAKCMTITNYTENRAMRVKSKRDSTWGERGPGSVSLRKCYKVAY